MHEAAEELHQHIRHWASEHELSSEQVVVILARMIGNYEGAAFDAASERREATVTKRK